MVQQQLPNFELDVLPHLDAAYNLAHWLMRNEQDTQDVVQDAVLRAVRYFAGLRNRDARAWLMKIVRNSCYTKLREKPPVRDAIELDEELLLADPDASDPESHVLREEVGAIVRRAVEALPTNLREVLILREMERMSYRDIAAITGMPAGTVMSTLSRARRRLRQSLSGFMNGDAVLGSPHSWQ